MKPFITLLVLLMGTATLSRAQGNLGEEDAIKMAINKLFDGMRTSDTTLMKSVFSPQVVMQTIATSREGKSIVKTENFNAFLKSIATPHPEKYDEQIQFTKILIDQNLASVWTDYKFFIGEKFSHCGVNSFQLWKGPDGWKIIYLIDTRRKENCN